MTSNLIDRAVQHREGAFDGFTRRHAIYRLVWVECAETMNASIAAEKRIKKWPRGSKKNLIDRGNPAWNDLALTLFSLPPLGRR